MLGFLPACTRHVRVQHKDKYKLLISIFLAFCIWSKQHKWYRVETFHLIFASSDIIILEKKIVKKSIDINEIVRWRWRACNGLIQWIAVTVINARQTNNLTKKVWCKILKVVRLKLKTFFRSEIFSDPFPSISLDQVSMGLSWNTLHKVTKLQCWPRLRLRCSHVGGWAGTVVDRMGPVTLGPELRPVTVTLIWCHGALVTSQTVPWSPGLRATIKLKNVILLQL